MKTLIQKYILLVIPAFLIISCKKTGATFVGTSSLNIINATPALSSVALNFAPNNLPYYLNATSLSYGSSMEFGLPVGANAINFISSADTSQILLSKKLNLKLGTIYSLYLIGNSIPVDTLFLQDHIPAIPDSSAGARFINLSFDSEPVSINIEGDNTSVINGLGYKKETAFKTYPATKNITTNGGYIFDITDASGNVTSYNWNPIVFKNNTIVISGSVNDGTLMIFSVNNY